MTAELDRIAAAIAIPVDGRGIAARPVVDIDHRLGKKPGTGTTTYRVGFDLAGRRELVGPSLPKPRQALDLANLLDLHRPTSRPGATAIAAAVSSARVTADEIVGRRSGGPTDEREPSHPTEAPGTPDPIAGGGDRMCVVCGSAVPAGSRTDRVTCGPACRKAASRATAGRASAIAPPDEAIGAAGHVTPTRPSGAVGPKSSRAPGPPPASAPSRRSDLRRADRRLGMSVAEPAVATPATPASEGR